MRTLFFLATFSYWALAATSQTLRVSNGAEPQDLDPQTVTGTPEFNILINLFEGLVTKDPKTLEILPAVAERWKVSPDGKSYTFYLRKDARWSDGTPVTASDFVYSWARLLDPKTAAEYAPYGYYIVNGEKYAKGEIKDINQLGVSALGDHTLKVTLVNPTTYFLSLLTQPCLAPVPKKAIEKFGKNWTRPENMISNGPFQLSEWKMNQSILAKKNPFYWDRSHVKLDKINFLVIDNKDTEEKMFRTKEIDLTQEVPLEKLALWKKDKTGSLQSYDYLAIYFYRLNVSKPPLNNPKVRKALNLAINRQDLVNYVTKANQTPARGLVPPGAGRTYSGPMVLPTDLSRLSEAKRLLKEAGYPDGKGLPSLEILYNTHEAHKKIAEALQQMWKVNLNLNVTLNNQEWKVFLDTVNTGGYQIARAGWTGNYNDPNAFLELFQTGSPTNRTGWSNLEYDELLKKAAKEKSVKARFTLLEQAESILLEELPVIPLYYYKRNCLKSAKVKGWYPNLEDYHPLKLVTIEG